ncbi:MAG: SDR family oxidoreductase [Campylobacteraceae bacterium]|jgi:NAD(P)-dependent dehydrogenase (short-subunit alcohol dehydrogenase family)|nr:SDR family oxidoreductase [Campylobacteraceae bacterium]
MKNKIILITGATDGIGKESAKALAKQGHTLILHGRNETKAQAVCEEIKSETGNNNIDIIIADLLSFQDIKRMADDFKKKYDRLDVLINNAGSCFGKVRETTKSGFEKTMALNLFAPFLLTELLLDILAKSPAARVVNVSSKLHEWSGKPDFGDLQLEKNYAPVKAYGLSKLYLIWITRHLSSLLQKKGITNITVNSVHPGAVATNIWQRSDKGFIYNLLSKLASPVMVKPSCGAQTSIYVATSSDLENVSGKYFANKKIAKTCDKYYSPENEQAIWDYCKKITEKYL